MLHEYLYYKPQIFMAYTLHAQTLSMIIHPDVFSDEGD